MDSVRIRVSQLVDYGTVMQVIGVEIPSRLPVVISVDYRPVSFWQAWQACSPSNTAAFAAARPLELSLDFGHGPEEFAERAEYLPDD